MEGSLSCGGTWVATVAEAGSGSWHGAINKNRGGGDDAFVNSKEHFFPKSWCPHSYLIAFKLFE